MGFSDPFYGYSVLLRAIVYGVVPAFTAWQIVRLRRALHIFQLDGYKRARFMDWVRRNRRRALFLGARRQKKALVMTGRAWRILIVATLLSVGAILLPSAAAHLAGGAPWDLVTWAVATACVFVGAPRLITLADVLLVPVQSAINARYLRAARRRLSEVRPVVVGITGSFGKTSTKLAVRRLLGPEEAVLATPDSFNTPLGVCRTINEQLAPAHRYFVVEMGAYKEGDIAELARFARPRIGVLTSIGPAHLKRFGSIDAVRKAKYELVAALGAEDTAVMNVDDPEVRALADKTEHVPVVRYGLDPSGAPDVTARAVQVGPAGTDMTVVDAPSGGSVSVRTRLVGRHATGHVLAAIAVARAAGRPLSDLAGAIDQLEPPPHRLQLIEGTGGVTVIDDAYNSNPQGAAAALEVLAAMPGGGRKVVVTPGMIELGDLQAGENERFGEAAGAVADTVIVVGSTNRAALVAGAERARRAEVVAVDTLADATERLRVLLGPGDVVLFENDLPDQYEG
ncbi:MAG: Mur ligase family protein [Actinomycetota bacterium]